MELYLVFQNNDTDEYVEKITPVSFTGDSSLALSLTLDTTKGYGTYTDSVSEVVTKTLTMDIDIPLLLSFSTLVSGSSELVCEALITHRGISVRSKSSLSKDDEDFIRDLLNDISDEVSSIFLKRMASGLSSSMSGAMKAIDKMMGKSAKDKDLTNVDEIIDYINNETKGHVLKPEVSLKDYMCNKILNEELNEIKDFMERYDDYKALNIEIPIGILFKGAPGTGKTYAAKCIAGSTDCYFISCTASSLQGMYIGSGSQNIRELFNGAKMLQKASKKGVIVFIDEIDSLGSRDSHKGGAGGEEDRTLNQLLAEMCGFEEVEKVMVMGATNYAERLDDALLRSGRFSRQINIPYPDEEERKVLVEYYFNNIKMPIVGTNAFEIAALAYGLSPADIKEIANESAILAMRYKRKEISLEDINEAINKCITKNIRNEDKDYLDVVTAHECGHVLAESLYLDSISIKVTNYSYGDAGGFTQPAFKLDGIIDKSKFIANVKVLLAGRAAENVMCHTETNGASNDLQKAARILTNYYEVYFFENYKVTELEQLVNDKLEQLYNEVIDDFKKPENLEKLEKLIEDLTKKRVLYKLDLTTILSKEDGGSIL